MGRTEQRAALDAACRKTRKNCEKIGKELREFPGDREGDYFRQNRDGLCRIGHIFCWTPSFFTGMAALAYREKGEEEDRKWIEGFYRDYYAKVFEHPWDTMHDLGFMYTLYSTFLYRLTGEERMRELSLQAARVLYGRFVPEGRYIRAWGRMDDTIPDYIGPELREDNFFRASGGLAIIDCMMNLPLLFWASEETGDFCYRKAAMAHADTTLYSFIREDNSVCHAWRFDEKGNSLGEFNDCGYGVGSHWARGTAWAVYGFAVAWRYTGSGSYLDAACRLADKYLEECGGEAVPVWDFRLPEGEPARYGGKERVFDSWDITRYENRRFNVDTSAAVILAGGLNEILHKGGAGKSLREEKYKAYVEKVLDVVTKQYLNMDADIPGFLSMQNGEGIYAVFGDYFAMELLAQTAGGYRRIW